MRKITLIFVASTALTVSQSGYTARYPVQYDSIPQSALVTCGGVQQGYTPVNTSYGEEAIKDGILRTAPCSATWVSGAQASFSTIFDTKSKPTGLKTTVNRPNDPNISNDILFDSQRKQNETQAAYQKQQYESQAAYQRQRDAAEAAQRDAAEASRRDEADKRSYAELNKTISDYNNANKTTSCQKIAWTVICNTY